MGLVDPVGWLSAPCGVSDLPAVRSALPSRDIEMVLSLEQGSSFTTSVEASHSRATSQNDRPSVRTLNKLARVPRPAQLVGEGSVQCDGGGEAPWDP